MFFEFFDPEAAILEGVSQHKHGLDFPLPGNFTENDKWLASSSLQKAVRRNRVAEAMKAARVLMLIDEAYLWRRLKIIALEDIGVANMNMAGQVLWGAGKKQWQEKHGGREQFLSYFVQGLCASKKCRSLDDSLYVANFHPLYSSQRRSYSDLSEKELFEQFASPGLDVAERVITAWYLSGTRRYFAKNLDARDGKPNVMIDLAHYIGVPPFIADILKMAKGNEFYISLLPCWIQVEQSRNISVVEEIKEPSVIIGEWPSESMDKHTRPGKMAFREFLNQCTEVSALLHQNLPAADHVDVLGYAVFGIEGRLLDRRLDFEGATCLFELAMESWLQHSDMSKSIRDDLLRLMEKHIATLHESRRNVLIKLNKMHSGATS